MTWSFGLVNGKLAEVFFEIKKGKQVVMGHAYVHRSDYSTKEEKKWIKLDTEKIKLIYRKGKYQNA